MPMRQRPGASRRETRGHLVAALVGSPVAPFELGVAHEVFGVDRSEYADPWYRFRVVGAFGQTIPVSGGGWSITTPHTLDDLAEAETILLPGWPDWDRPAPPELLDVLRAAHARGARLVSVCTGAFLLAQPRAARRPPGDDALDVHGGARRAAPDSRGRPGRAVRRRGRRALHLGRHGRRHRPVPAHRPARPRGRGGQQGRPPHGGAVPAGRRPGPVRRRPRPRARGRRPDRRDDRL